MKIEACDWHSLIDCACVAWKTDMKLDAKRAVRFLWKHSSPFGRGVIAGMIKNGNWDSDFAKRIHEREVLRSIGAKIEGTL